MFIFDRARDLIRTLLFVPREHGTLPVWSFSELVLVHFPRMFCQNLSPEPLLFKPTAFSPLT